MKTIVTTMFVRGAPARVQASRSTSSSLKASVTNPFCEVSKARNLDASPVEKRAPNQGIDGVNLNVAEGQVAEPTFVETRTVGDDDDE